MFNGEKHLERCLASIEGQTFRDFELIISDNASQDRTPEICRALAARDPRVRYVRNPENIGIMENFAAAAGHARGELFAWTASDDFWEAQFLEALVEALDANPAVDLAYAGYDWVDGAGNSRSPGLTQAAPRMPALLAPYLRFGPANHRLRRMCLYWWWRSPFLFQGLFRRAALMPLLPFEYPCSYARNTDTLLVIKFLCQHDVVLVDRVLWHYRLKERELPELASYYAPGARPEAMPPSVTPAMEERAFLARVMRVVRESGMPPTERRLLLLALPVLSRARQIRLWIQKRQHCGGK